MWQILVVALTVAGPIGPPLVHKDIFYSETECTAAVDSMTMQIMVKRLRKILFKKDDPTELTANCVRIGWGV